MVYRFNHPEWLVDIPKPNLKAADGNIIIYGAGMCGALAYHALKQYGLRFLAYSDSNETKHGQVYYEHIILSPANVRDKYPDALILVASGFYIKIHQALVKLGYSNEQIFPCFLIFDGIDFDDFKSPWSEEYIGRSIRRLSIKSLKQMGVSMDGHIEKVGLSPTDRCTLKCRDCSVHTPYVMNPKDYDLEKMILSVKNIVEAGFYIDDVVINSGEPFLYKPLATLVNNLIKLPNVERIYVVTNATLLPSTDLLGALSNDRVIVRMSNYGELSTKYFELLSLLKDNNINFEETRHAVWWKHVDWKTSDETPEQLQERFNNCTCSSQRGVVNIGEGKAYLCLPASFLDIRGWVDIPANECVDLLDASVPIKPRLNALLNRKEYNTACQNCLFRGLFDSLDRVPVALQLPSN
jgi:organic radical activating enzyme